MDDYGREFVGSTDLIKVDGVVGRVIRNFKVTIKNGTNANTIKVATILTDGGWNGDINTEINNLSKGGTSGAFSLSANGQELTIGNAGLTGDIIAVLSCNVVYNGTSTDIIFVDHYFNSGIVLYFTTTAGAIIDLAAITDTGDGYVYIRISYITSA